MILTQYLKPMKSIPYKQPTPAKERAKVRIRAEKVLQAKAMAHPARTTLAGAKSTGHALHSMMEVAPGGTPVSFVTTCPTRGRSRGKEVSRQIARRNEIEAKALRAERAKVRTKACSPNQ